MIRELLEQPKAAREHKNPRKIIGQQISTKANQTIWDRMVAGLGAITPRVISNLSPEALQQYGLSWRKVGYIKEVADRVYNGSLQLDELPAKSDSKVCRLLSSLPGIGK